MKLLELTLRNWRGVNQASIRFADGVTLIEGDNEIGKSSLVEALRMLFREQDSSKKKTVKAVQPVGTDVGSFVEAEVRCGDHHFIYSKTYNKKTATELRILEPAPEQLVGGDAHNRAWDILDGAIDVALWDALLVEQGKEIGGVKLSDSDGLARALDSAAGGAGASGEESALYDAVQSEYGRYFTKTGKSRYGSEQERVDTHASQVKALTAQLLELEDDLRKFESVSVEIQRLQRALPVLEQSLEEHSGRWQAINSLQARLTAKEDEAKPLQQLLDNARAELERRRQAVMDIGRREAVLGERREQLQPLAENVAALEATVAAGTELLKTLHSQRRSLQHTVAQARQDANYLADTAELARLQQLLERVSSQREEVSTLEQALAQVRIDSAGRRAIQAAANAVEVACKTRDNAATLLTIAAYRDVQFALDDEQVSIVAGEQISRSLAETLAIDIPQLALITIAPTVGANELAAEVAARQRELDDLLARYQVPDVEAAISADEYREDATRSLGAARQRLDDTLQGANEDNVRASCVHLQQACAAYTHLRGSVLPASVHEASGALERASEALEAVEAELEQENTRLEQQRVALAREQAAQRGASAEVNALASVLQEKEATLARERGVGPDAALEQLAAARAEKVAAIDSELHMLRQQLQAQDPDTVRVLLDNATQACRRAGKDLIDRQQELAVIKSRLDRAQANGLFEEREAAEQVLAEAEEQLRATERRATAVQLLWHTLNEHRDASRQAYVQPLREGIQSLGKIVFGHDFEVALDEDWTILSCTRAGQTVPFESLSVGAREQLGIITRLAAARIIADSGGVPVIIDDALGFADPTRLQGMGAVIAAAGRDTQVVILTCTPGRFMYVGDVGVVRL
ncbi:MAG TPA: AAA family ATPase [Kineobactrum sp.]